MLEQNQNFEIVTSSHVETESPTPLEIAVPESRQDILVWQGLGMPLIPLDPDTTEPVIPLNEWMQRRSRQTEIDHFNANPSHAIGCILQEGYLAVLVPDHVFHVAWQPWASSNNPFSLPGGCGQDGMYTFIFHNELEGRIPVWPDSVTVKQPGEIVLLADGVINDKTIELLKGITPVAPLREESVAALQETVSKQLPATGNPLEKFSLRGKGDALAASAQPAVPFLDKVCLAGQATFWYASPNSGKTLITLALLIEAVQSARIAAGNVYYLNADDSSQGIAEKTQLLEAIGVHMLAPGLNGFEAKNLAPLLREVVHKGKAKGTFLVIDTAKKFVDLTKRGDRTDFNDACRAFVVSGGTMLCLAHTNKNRSADGKLVHTGTNDMVEDADAVHLIDVIDGKEPGQRVAVFECRKSRGPSAEKAAYAYDGSKDLNYEQRLATVTAVNPETLAELQVNQRQVEDAEIIETIKQLLSAKPYGKMDLVAEVKRIEKVTKRQALKVIEAHTGEIPGTHLWTYTVRDRGRQVFTLLPA